MVAHIAPFALTACAAPGYVEVPVYQHYYFYEPRVVVVPTSVISAGHDGETMDLSFQGSENILSITTFATRGDQGYIVGNPGKVTDYTGILAFDALNSDSIPMRLWVSASCRSDDWVILPGNLRLVDPGSIPSEIPLSVYRQPSPAALHPDSRVFTGYWRYAPLDSNREIPCRRGETVAFTVGFDMTLTLNHLKIVFADSLRRDDKVVPIPDVDLSLAGGKKVVSTTRTSIPEFLLRIGGAFAH